MEKICRVCNDKLAKHHMPTQGANTLRASENPLIWNSRDHKLRSDSRSQTLPPQHVFGKSTASNTVKVGLELGPLHSSRNFGTAAKDFHEIERGQRGINP